MNRSLKTTLLVRTTAASAVVLACLGVGLFLAIRENLVRNFDSGLRAKAQALEAMVEQREEKLHFDFDPEAMPEFVRGKHPAFFEMWQDGTPWRRSPSLGASDLTSGRGMWIHLNSGEPGRMVTVSFTPHMDDEGEKGAHSKASRAITLSVARDTEDMDDELFNEMWIVVISCAAAIVISGVTLVMVVNRAVRPVETVAAQIENVREEDLSGRVDAAGIPAELVPLVEKLNGLLARLGQAFERERGFTADVAHELRTPLAGMRATLEVCRSRPRDEAGYAGSIDKSLKMLGAMQRMVENLLLLARAESGQLSVVTRETDVAGLVKESWVAFAERAAERGLRVQWRVPERCVGRCDPENLRIVLNNLFDNAVTYAASEGLVEIRVTPGEGTVEISISNSGCDLTGAEVQRVFERFWRSDAARTQTGVHAGLGLSLCQRLMKVMGGSVGATCEGGVFTVKVRLKR